MIIIIIITHFNEANFKGPSRSLTECAVMSESCKTSANDSSEAKRRNHVAGGGQGKIKMEMREIMAPNGVSVNVNCKCKGQPS